MKNLTVERRDVLISIYYAAKENDSLSVSKEELDDIHGSEVSNFELMYLGEQKYFSYSYVEIFGKPVKIAMIKISPKLVEEVEQLLSDDNLYTTISETSDQVEAMLHEDYRDLMEELLELYHDLITIDDRKERVEHLQRINKVKEQLDKLEEVMQ